MRMRTTGELLNERYRIEATLGEGAFGVVAKALDLTSSRYVAIKMLKAAAGGYDATMEARFMREMRMIAVLQSPHTVKLFDFGRTSDGLLFMVCELVEGEDLVRLIERRGRLPERDALHILQQALMSLAEAHDHGVLHRDIKPHNIRVFPYEDDSLRVKVLDFGLARPMQDDANLTGTGQVVGTLRYMSPEQLYDGMLTPASDIYSLGIVGVEMVLGREATKFEDYRVFSSGEFTGIALSTRVVLQRMTELDPSQRYSTAAEALRDIRQALAGVDLASEEPTTRHTAREAPAAEDQTTQQRHAPQRQQPQHYPPQHHPQQQHPAHPQQQTVRPARFPWWVAALAALVGAVVVAVALFSGEPEPPPSPTPTPRGNVDGLFQTQEVPLPSVEVAEPLGSEDAGRDDTGLQWKRLAVAGCRQPDFNRRGFVEVETLQGLDTVSSLIYVPQTYDPDKEHPVVILFHNDAKTGRAIVQRTLFFKIADEKGIILVLPNSGMLAWRTPATVRGIEATVRQASELLCVDLDRVFAVGHSVGAAGADYLACTGFPLAGIVANSYRPSDREPTCRGLPALPTMLISPADSRRIPPDGTLSCSTARVHLTIADYEALYLDRNACSGDRIVLSDDETATCWRWACDEPLTSCHVKGGVGWAGSGIPELDPLQCDPDSSDFPTNEAIWAFMESVAPAKTDRGQ